MSELLRPEPPRSPTERLAAARAALSPVRALVTLAVALALLAGGWWLVRPAPTPVEDSLPRATPAGGGPAASPAVPPSLAPAEVMVQVAGAVANPGVYRLGDGARVIELIEAAGGPLPEADMDAMALASRLADGQRVQVPRQGEALPDAVTGRSPPEPAGGGVAAPVDLNTAGVDQLDTLPGVGPTTALAIVAYRDRHGPFRSIEDLTEVQGIGPARLEALRDLVRV